MLIEKYYVELLLGIAVFLGASLGSFLNVVIYRVPNGLNIAHPPSACPKCGYVLKWYDNIPILSYLMLGAKCRQCKTHISMQYPIVELIGAIMGTALYLEFDFSIEFGYYIMFVFGMIALTYIDIKEWIVPVSIVIVMAIVGVIVPILTYFLDYLFIISIKDSLIGGVLGFGVIATIIVLYKFLRGIDALGWGDAYILALVGLYMGPKSVLATLFFAVVQASVIGIGMIVFNKKATVPYDDLDDDDPIKDKAALPFVPFLAIAAIEYLFFGERLITLYLNFMRNLIS